MQHPLAQPEQAGDLELQPAFAQQKSSVLPAPQLAAVLQGVLQAAPKYQLPIALPVPVADVVLRVMQFAQQLVRVQMLAPLRPLPESEEWHVHQTLLSVDGFVSMRPGQQQHSESQALLLVPSQTAGQLLVPADL